MLITPCVPLGTICRLLVRPGLCGLVHVRYCPTPPCREGSYATTDGGKYIRAATTTAVARHSGCATGGTRPLYRVPRQMPNAYCLIYVPLVEESSRRCCIGHAVRGRSTSRKVSRSIDPCMFIPDTNRKKERRIPLAIVLRSDTTQAPSTTPRSRRPLR